MTASPAVLLERRGNVGHITLAPGATDDSRTWAEVGRACADISTDDESVVVVVAGNLDFEHAERFDGNPRARTAAIEAIAVLPQVTVAVIELAAGGPGLEIALACDIRLATTGAGIRFPEVRDGFIPGASVTQRLPRIVGHARAAELVLTAASIDATQAQAIGLVHRVAPPETFDELVANNVARIATGAPVALRLAKEALRLGEGMSLETALVFEHDLYLLLQTTGDRNEGLAALREGRQPRFGGS